MSGKLLQALGALFVLGLVGDFRIPLVFRVRALHLDTGFRYRFTYGAPLTAFGIGKFIPRPLRDISLTLSYEYFRELSNITNYSYTNNAKTYYCNICFI
jgi:hypothetical protein